MSNDFRTDVDLNHLTVMTSSGFTKAQSVTLSLPDIVTKTQSVTLAVSLTLSPRLNLCPSQSPYHSSICDLGSLPKIVTDAQNLAISPKLLPRLNV